MTKHSMALLVALMANNVMAKDDTASLFDDLFVGVKSGYQILDDDQSHQIRPNAYNLGVFTGFQLTDNVSWDIGYHYWGDAQLDEREYSVDILETGLRYDHYITQNTSLFARAGLGYAWTETSGAISGSSRSSNIVPLIEVGGHYWLSKNWSTGVSYQYTRGFEAAPSLDIDAHSINLSLTYGFDNNKKVASYALAQHEEQVLPHSYVFVELHEDTVFDLDSAQLTDQGKETIRDFVSRMPKKQGMVISVIGHTDNSGSEEYNQTLSERRALAVKTYMVELGLDESLITAVGQGELEPKYSNDSKSGRKKNRHVEILTKYND
ncbi:OmpA family protein [Vibrio parahaemolyticus]|nr:OmpA family protein [Vibrio parahaemolyticus]